MRYLFELVIPLLLMISSLFYYKDLSNNDNSSKLGSLFLVLSTIYAMGIGICSALFEERFIISSIPDALIYSICLIGFGQILSEIFGKTSKLGLFTVLPLFLGSTILPFIPHQPWNIKDPYFSLHILASMSAYSFFFIAGILAFMQSILWNKLKKKQFDSIFKTLPNFEKIEKYSVLWVLFGIFTGAISGALGIKWWAESDSGLTFPYFSFIIILPFTLVIIGKFLGLINGILFARAIFVSLLLLIITHTLGLH